MSHPSEAQLLAFADHELDERRRREIEAHMRGCDLCRHALRDVEQAMAGMAVELALIDTEEPARWRAVVADPDAERATDRGSGRRISGPRSASFGAASASAERSSPAARARLPMRVAAPARSARSLRWAAVMLVIVGGGAAAMAAPRWFARTTPAAAAASATPASATHADDATTSAAVSILPVSGEATVVLTAGSGGDGRVLVELSDRSDVQVTVSTAASEHATPRFTSADGRLAVQLTGRGSLVRVSVPATLRAARITYDGTTVATVAEGVVAPAEARTSGIALPQSAQAGGTEPR